MAKRGPLELPGGTALITGASAGIGLAVARQLARRGMNLAIAARHADRLEAAASELRSHGVRVLPVPTDVGRTDDLERLVERTLGEFSTIDVLVNNAGIEAFSLFERLPVERIIETIQVNLTSALVLSRLVIPTMLLAKGGHVVNMSSTAGKHGPAYGAAYGASKAGLIAFTQAIRAEYRGRCISASVICPGFTDDGGIYDRMRQTSGRRSPRLVGSTTAEHVAAVVLRAVEHDVPEIIVNWPPLRPVMAFTELFPRWGSALIRTVSIRFLKRVAETAQD